MNANRAKNQRSAGRQPGPPGDPRHGSIVLIPEEGCCLGTVQLEQLEQAIRNWADGSSRADVRAARRRILTIFLLIRYTGAKLSEVLTLNPSKDIDTQRNVVLLRGGDAGRASRPREVQISERLSSELRALLSEPSFQKASPDGFDVDPGFVRRKFYECTQSAGYPKHLGGPEMIRKARAVELMQGNLPLPAVQKMMGHSTPNLTTAYVSFSAEEIQQVTRLFIEREASRKTSARNSFFGKIQTIRQGDIQSLVTLVTLGGYTLTTVITNASLKYLALKAGTLITAEVKAPWVILHAGQAEPQCSAENRFAGIVAGISKGRVNAEYSVRLDDGTMLCAVVAAQGGQVADLNVGDPVWAAFNAFAVVLHTD